jgi:hypothetical protein
MIVGSRLAGAQGAAWGLFLDQVVLIPLWFWTLSGVLRSHAARAAAETLPEGIPANAVPPAELTTTLDGDPLPAPLDLDAVSPAVDGHDNGAAAQTAAAHPSPTGWSEQLTRSEGGPQPGQGRLS